MSEADIRTKIKAILGAVTNVGAVYDYRRNAASDSEFILLFKQTVGGVDHIRGWMIHRRSASEQAKTTAAPHVYELNGYLGIKDATATEKTFTALVEAVRDKFRADATLYNAGYAHDPVQVEQQDDRQFGAVLCHHAQLSITVYDMITS